MVVVLPASTWAMMPMLRSFSSMGSHEKKQRTRPAETHVAAKGPLRKLLGLDCWGWGEVYPRPGEQRSTVGEQSAPPSNILK